MVVCVLYSRFTLVAALEGRRELMGEPVALAPEPGRRQAIGEVSPAAEAFGGVPGVRVGRRGWGVGGCGGGGGGGGGPPVWGGWGVCSLPIPTASGRCGGGCSG